MASPIALEEEEKMCRYCFDGEEEGELIAPCACSGAQRWVHLACLRSWQRAVLVDQPTHPDFYDDDERHRICNVCTSRYTCKPPTRLDLMESFTGKELAALIKENFLIGASKRSSDEMRRLFECIPSKLRQGMVERHWIGGVFLINEVIKDAGESVELCLGVDEAKARLIEEIGEDFTMQIRGRCFRLLFEGVLQGHESSTVSEKRKALSDLEMPCHLNLVPTDGGDPGEDQIVAVSLTNPIDLSSKPMHSFKELRWKVATLKARQGILKGLDLPPVAHFSGGPCHSNKVRCVISISAEGNYVAHQTLEEALTFAKNSVDGSPRADTVASGIAAAHNSCAEPRQVRRRITRKSHFSGSSSSRGLPSAGSRCPQLWQGVCLRVFWGTACWSRCQLVSEIASGSWGLCNGSAEQVTSINHAELYKSVLPRLVFAPVSKMTPEDEGDISLEERRARIYDLGRGLVRRHAAADRHQDVMQMLEGHLEQPEADRDDGQIANIVDMVNASENDSSSDSDEDEEDDEDMESSQGSVAEHEFEL